ncbi:leucyl aminopeptidase [Caminibacter mediatlanticus TB-2]|uniref:Probable cytosol aminopeptidase n=1 Tax=Caminibacter mediatlanticus TB-2 TaxID=391592 RepID=A0ABX5V921_9BACT|nr:leucyl aminopeptidase [Caminibacter mediatlanticus]QCT94790.1 leucyl aminopeptidase [Caminibacter mediatlanticus TB-2]
MRFIKGKGEVKAEIVVNGSKKFEEYGFEGKDGEVLVLPDRKRIYVGIDEINSENLKIATSKIIKLLKNYKFESVEITPPNTKDKDLLLSFFEGFLLGDYEFDKYKSKKAKHPIKTIAINSKRDFDEIIKEAQIRANTINFVRNIINSMPDELTPAKLASIAEEVAKENRLECKIFDENYLLENGYNAFYAVSKASAHPPRLIHLIYKPKSPKKKIVLVGKGLTYDSGGLSLKPSDYMVTMKADKSGAVTVLGVIKVISELGIDVEVHAILGATENMIGGNAYKPDDVLKAKNGKTIEVRNTDAEGRLVLADCLCYAQENIKEFDYIFDLATLTGACVVGLGEYTAGVMGFNKEIIEKVIKTGKSRGEHFAYLPFNKYLPKLLKSNVADICNIASSRYGGALTAGLFLSEFIEEENKNKWVHLDIAGPAFVEKEWGYNPYGASGFGVDSLVSLLQNF